MYRILTSSKDTYITNKIINNKFRATDANVGQAGTLDLFKLYAENISGSDRTPTELSRILIKFDLDEVKDMHNNKKIDVGDSSFSAHIKLFDVYGGQTTPNNFKVIAMPLALPFDEGSGYDIVNFSDLDNTNWVTASYSNGTSNKWNQTGARKSGSLGESNIDVIISGTISGQSSAINLSAEQLFSKGTENLSLDVTNFVSASAKSLVTNHGFVIAYSGSYEKDDKTYFVKRFASRDSLNKSLRPQLTIQYDDTITDNHQNFEYDLTGSLYLNNFNRGQLANIVSGSSATELSGEKCMILKIQTGSFSKQFDVSQVLRGSTTKSTATITFSDKPNEEAQITLTDVEGTEVTFEVDNNNDGATDAVKATAEWIFTDKPNEQTTITITDYEGTSVVFEVDNDGNGASVVGAVPMDPATNDGAGMATILVQKVNDSVALKITATNPESGKVVLTQDSGAAAGNKAISFSDRANWEANTEPDVPTAFTGGAAGSIIPMDPATNNDAGMATIMASSVNGSSLKITATNPTATSVLLTQDIPGPLGDLTITTANSFNNATVPSSFSGGAFDGLTGIYSASFAISSFDSILYDHVLASGSIVFDEIWSNRNETVTYLSSSLTVSKNNITAISYSELRINVSLLNLKHRYKQDETARIRVFAQNADKELVFVKKPIETPSQIFSNMFYRVRDVDNGKIIIPFDDKTNSTKLSSDSKGMYFDFFMSSLQPGRTYSFDFLIKEQGFNQVIKDAASKFIIE